MTFHDLTTFFSFLKRENLVFVRYSYYLCPNIINFDIVDFSERRPEEVMFLLTLSVYSFIYTNHKTV